MNEIKTSAELPMRIILVFPDKERTATVGDLVEVLMPALRQRIEEIINDEFRKIMARALPSKENENDRAARPDVSFSRRPEREFTRKEEPEFTRKKEPEFTRKEEPEFTRKDAKLNPVVFAERQKGDIDAPLPGNPDPAISIFSDSDHYRRRLIWVYDAVKPGVEYTQTGKEFYDFCCKRGISFRASTRGSALTQVCHMLNELIAVGLLERRIRGGRYIRRVAKFTREDAILRLAECPIIVDKDGRRKIIAPEDNMARESVAG